MKCISFPIQTDFFDIEWKYCTQVGFIMFNLKQEHICTGLDLVILDLSDILQPESKVLKYILDSVVMTVWIRVLRGYAVRPLWVFD